MQTHRLQQVGGAGRSPGRTCRPGPPGPGRRRRPCRRKARAPRSAAGLPEWAGTRARRARPGSRPEAAAPASARRKEAAAGEGAAGVSRVRLTCRGARSPGSHPPRAGRGAGAALPASRPRRGRRRVCSAGPPAPPGSPRPPQSPRGSRAWSPEPRPPPTPGRARREGGVCGREEGRGAARLRGPGARVAPEPPAPRGLGWHRSARGRRRMLAGFPGLGPRSRRQGPGCAAAASATAVARG